MRDILFERIREDWEQIEAGLKERERFESHMQEFDRFEVQIREDQRIAAMMHPPAGMFLIDHELAAHRDYAAMSNVEMYLSPIARDLARMYDEALTKAKMLEEIEQRQLFNDTPFEGPFSTRNRFTDIYPIADVMPFMCVPRVEEPSEAEKIEPPRKPIGFHTEWLD